MRTPHGKRVAGSIIVRYRVKYSLFFPTMARGPCAVWTEDCVKALLVFLIENKASAEDNGGGNFKPAIWQGVASHVNAITEQGAPKTKESCRGKFRTVCIPLIIVDKTLTRCFSSKQPILSSKQSVIIRDGIGMTSWVLALTRIQPADGKTILLRILWQNLFATRVGLISTPLTPFVVMP
jgi:hypothetical protein